MSELNEADFIDVEAVSLAKQIKIIIEDIDDERFAIDIDLPEHCLTKINPPYFQRAVIEVLNNAFEHTTADGQVTLTVSLQNERAVTAIHNTGIAISDRHLPHLFDLFYRVDDAHTTRGLGLGLPIAKRIIELHQGNLSLTTTVNAGTTATISVPIHC